MADIFCPVFLLSCLRTKHLSKIWRKTWVAKRKEWKFSRKSLFSNFSLSSEIFYKAKYDTLHVRTLLKAGKITRLFVYTVRKEGKNHATTRAHWQKKEKTALLLVCTVIKVNWKKTFINCNWFFFYHSKLFLTF